MKKIETKYITERQEWREWFENNFETKDDIWLEYPLKKNRQKTNLIQ